MKRILIISGEGEIGTEETYNGTLTVRAIKSRLTRERTHGDRWAKAVLSTEAGNIDLDSDPAIAWALKEAQYGW